MTDPSPLRPERWDAAYRSRVPDRVTWYQGRPERSLSFIAATGFDSSAAVVPVGGRVIIATFALDGPVACSGLPVRRYGTDSLSRALGGRFEPVSFEYETHVTPTDATQQFLYGRFRRRDDRPDRPATSARLSHNCLAPDQREYTLIRGLRYLAHRRTRRPGNYALAAWMILVISSTVGRRPVILTSPLIASAGVDMTP